MFRTILNNKIGELLNALATEIPRLSLTKAIKLLYLIDEHAVRKSGVPLTWLDYKIWKNGPVPPELYHEIKHHQGLTFNNAPLSIGKFIRVERVKNPERNNQEEIYLHPNKEKELSQFSEQEQEIIREIISQYGQLNAVELISLLHKEGTLWDRHCRENQLQVVFDLFKNTSNVSVDFSELIREDPVRQMAAQSAYEALLFQERLLDE